MNHLILGVAIAAVMAFGGCAGGRIKERALDSAARYWRANADSGKGVDVQVVEASMGDDGLYHVKGIVDGEDRIGIFNPKTVAFSEDYQWLSSEYSKRIVELQQELIFWMGRAEASERENIQLSVQQKRK